jgi:hypothetical protein
MANQQPITDHLVKTEWRKGQSGNPSGRPKGSKNLSTWIQELLNDEDFRLDNFMFNGKTFSGAPIKAIITVGIMNALQGDYKWADWLAKRGYGNDISYDINSSQNRCFQCIASLDREKYDL